MSKQSKSGALKRLAGGLCLSLGLASGASAAEGDVKVTPLGSHDGEFCALDRAMVFEDPNGTRILYDAGRTVAGPDDPRLGNIDVVLVSHMHGDHVGDRRIKETNAGNCGGPEFPVVTLPQSNTVDIALKKQAKIVTGSEMPAFFAAKLEAAGGDPANSMLVRFGGELEVGGVAITTVPAVHSNGVSPSFLTGPLAEYLKAAGVGASVGPPTGYVLTFSNGLVVYLSGDTGITAEQKLVVNDHYGAELVVMNIGDTYTTGPKEAAYVINDLLDPKAVIASHANEPATSGGELKQGSRTALFRDLVKVPMHVPLSGRTIAFNGDGGCTAGCD
ncbi:L-ascorbate metabolism protein UlaG, beta-lactamase superfamily [Marinobacter antarcticus]|uniref:L-ascorbate metabolism protein UlaG, beta-lactamase superfamily n=1 Tax=Marinobacter antarcticus TaxID=564117 RepID=A0A1M6TWG3_9GAMM|nr:MBL fold metallo-hydrolase [Marinobacter antarcticus]SHK61233.1 L-ascorbate metabolism protein UlaG, beta-lactamase superfamily [Marinobacter antarcticus]